jgi:hypothetical protein
LHRRHPAWTPEDIDALPDGYAEDLIEAHAGWDEAVAVVQKRHARKSAPRHEEQGQPVYGMPGVRAPVRRPR